MTIQPSRQIRQLIPDRRQAYFFFLLGFFAIFSTTISKNPVLPLFSSAIGADGTVIGLIAAFSPLAGILFSFPVGVISDHVGRRRLLIDRHGISCRPASLSFHHQSLLADSGTILPRNSNRDPRPGDISGYCRTVPVSKRGNARSVFLRDAGWPDYRTACRGAIITLFMFSPGLIQYQMVYVAAALAAVPVFIMTLMYREDKPGQLNVLPFSVFRESFVTFFTNPRLRGTACVDMATYFTFGAFETFLPVLFLSFGISAYETGIIFAMQVLIIAITKPFFGRIADRYDKRTQIVLGLLILGCAAGIITLVSSFALFIVVSALFGIGISLSTVATSAYVADVAKKEQIGASLWEHFPLLWIGQSAGPLVTGMIITIGRVFAGFFAERCTGTRGSPGVYLIPSVRVKTA